MSETTDSRDTGREAAGQSARLWQVAGAGVAVAVAGRLLPVSADTGLAVTSTGIALVVLALILWLPRPGWVVQGGPGAEAGRIARHDPVPVFATDAAGVVVYQNPAAHRSFGRRIGEPVAKLLEDRLADSEGVVDRLADGAARTGGAREEVPTRKGTVRLAAHRIGGRGLLWRIEADERSALTVGGDAIGLPVVSIARSGAILSLNAAAEAFLGRRPEQLTEIVNDLPLRQGAVHGVRADGGTRRATVLEIPGVAGRKDIVFLPVAATPAHANNNDLVEDLPVPILKLCRTGEIRLANRAARQLLKLEPDEKIGLSMLLEGLNRPWGDWLAQAAERRGTGRPEFLQVSRAAQETYVQVTLSHVAGDDPEATVLAVLHDATELKSLEAQFVQSQKMQAIGQLAGGVAHDFNNLLTAIRGHCDLLLLRRDPGDPDFADLDQINQNANRAAALVSQLLAYSRKQTLRPELLDLRDTMGDLTHLLNRLVGEKITLNLTHDADAKMIRADRRQLEQVIVNLVVNARDAMPGGGAIDIQTRALHLDAELRRGRAVVPAGDYVEVRVSDCGDGIDPDIQEKVFEPFYTTKRAGEGTGLGLSTVYGIVKQTGGFIFIESAPGEGATFQILFPAHEPEEAPEQAPEAPAPEARAPDRQGVVLLVEDEAPVRAFASRALRLQGYTVLEAASAEEALEKLTDGALHVDVFVTDVVMPGLDGPTWVAEALQKRPGTRVVFVSGYAEESVAEGQAKIPQSIFLPKPFSLAQLTEAVQSQMA